jgi:hypothetical protein
MHVSVALILAIAGALCGTAGSVVTAFSLNRVLTELKLAQGFVQITLKWLAARGSMQIFEGMNRRIEKAQARSSKLVWFGVVLLALGFVLQAASVLIQKNV